MESVLTYSMENPINCDYCQKTFSSKETMRMFECRKMKQVALYHSKCRNENTIKGYCPICNYPLASGQCRDWIRKSQIEPLVVIKKIYHWMFEK